MKNLLFILFILPIYCFAQDPAPASPTVVSNVQHYQKIVGTDTLYYEKGSDGLWRNIARQRFVKILVAQKADSTRLYGTILARNQDSLTKKANRTFDNVAAGAIPITKLAASTISGVSLGGNLANLTATNTSLTFSGTYNGSTARTIGFNYANSGTFTAPQTFTNDANSVRVEGAAGTERSYSFFRGSLLRWRWYMSSASESGSNAGSNIALGSYDDAGNLLGNPISINRANRLSTIFQQALTNAPSGTAGTDSILVHDNTGKGVRAIAPDYYARTADARGRVSLSGNVTGILNYDYLNATSSTYSIQTPTCGVFTTDGSKIITGLVTGTGKIRVTCPVGYTIQTPSGFVTPSTGYAEIIQNQKFQLIPVGANAYYLQVLNGSVTVI